MMNNASDPISASDKPDPLAALREAASAIHNEAAGVLEVFVVWPGEVPRLVAEAVLGDPLAATLASVVAQLSKSVNGSPRWAPALCACCPRSVRMNPFTPVVVVPRNDQRTQGLGLAICERCAEGRSREELHALVVLALRGIWPDARPLPPIHHEGGRA